MAEIPKPQGQTVAAIYDTYSRDAQHERTYLGMSTFDTDCERAQWYAFRWVSPPQQFDGRMLRLFQTGHREEDRMIADLRRAGVTVEDHDPATGEQWELVASSGHFCGHMDGKASGFPEAPKADHVLELKTHNDKSFTELVRVGVQKAKPGHYAQMQLYMHFAGVDRAYYLAHNKNDDQLHGERVKYDPVFAGAMAVRGERIVRAARPPAKLHEDPTAKMAFACGFCPHAGVCHERRWPRSNCRTCIHSTPIDGGRWICELHDHVLTKADQQEGCPWHRFIPDLVPGEQFDVDLVNQKISYRLPDGSVWIDGAVS